MKLSAVQILLSLCATALGAETSDVVDLSTSNFDEHLKKYDLVLAEFFAPWCGHCKELAPQYEQAASGLKNKTDKISLAKIDCTENQALCQEQEIAGFPTLYIFEDGQKTGQYQGPRKAEDITRFMLKRSLPLVSNVNDKQGLNSWLEENHETQPVVFLYLGPKDSIDTFAQAAKSFRERASFLSASDDKLRKEFGNADIVVLKHGEADGKPTATFPAGSELTEASVTNFIKGNEFPAFGELGPDTYSSYIANSLPMLYAFVTQDSERDLVKKAVTPHLESLNGKANVVFLNASIYGMHAENVNLRSEFPAMVVHDVKSNKKYVHDQDTQLSESSISKFIKQYINGEIEPFVKSEAVPETQDEPVYVLVGSQYDDVVLDDSKDVLVEYYAPWCGHCKNLKPIYEELGEHFKGNDNVVIAKLDHTLNEVPDKIMGYPTIKFYPAGKKDSPVDFDGARDLKSLISFIETHGNAAPASHEKKAVKDEL